MAILEAQLRPGNADQLTDEQASAIGATAAVVIGATAAVEAPITTLITQSQIAALFKIAR